MHGDPVPEIKSESSGKKLAGRANIASPGKEPSRRVDIPC